MRRGSRFGELPADLMRQSGRSVGGGASPVPGVALPPLPPSKSSQVLPVYSIRPVGGGDVRPMGGEGGAASVNESLA